MTIATLHKMKATDEFRGYPTPFAVTADSELFLDLGAGAAYWVEACLIYRTYYDYGQYMPIAMQYSGTFYDPGVHIRSMLMPASKLYYYENRGSGGNAWATSQAGMQATLYGFTDEPNSDAARGMVWWSGRITTSTTGRLSICYGHTDNGFGGPYYPVTAFAGSWIYATPLDICPI